MERQFDLLQYKGYAIRLVIIVIASYAMAINAVLPAEGFDGECQDQALETSLESNYLRTTEIFLCQGLNRGGNPRKPMETGKSTDWEKINICVYVTTRDPSSLSARWVYERQMEFAGRGVFKQVSQDGYLVFSLEEAVACSDASVFQNYLADEIELGYIPAGHYLVEILQDGKIIDTLSFYVVEK